MKRLFSSVISVPLVAALALFAGAKTASAVSLYGQLGNFDVFNDTGQECHGFEIELDDVSSADVVYAFGAPNTQYGTPVKVDFNDGVKKGVYVRYESAYDSANKKWAVTTVIPPGITPTAGHACWVGGVPVGGLTYPKAGCEHFGVSLVRNPTNTIYRWLVEDKNNPGTLVRAGTNVQIPAPAFVVPPPSPIGPPPPQPVIQAFMPAPVPPPEAPEIPPGQYGDAIWVKIFVHQLDKQAELNRLVSNSDDPNVVPEVPDQSEVEIEWAISQKAPAIIDPNEGEREDDANLNAGNESVVRRYEFYKYMGGYDPDNHQALCDAPDTCQGNAQFPNGVGPFIGSQNVAANLVPGTQIQAQVNTGGFGYSRFTRTYVGVVKVKNTGAQDVTGPVAVVFADLPAGASLVNQSGTFQGSPYLVIPSLSDQAKTFAPNQTVSFTVQFKSNTAISFTPTVFSGRLQPL